jgi:hypothetical protein
VDEHAPMPEAMQGRGENCWICHNGPEFTYLFEESSPEVGEDASPSPGPSAGTGSVDGPLYALDAPALP